MLRKQDGPGAIRMVLIATFRLLPEHLVCSTLFLFPMCDSLVFAYIAFYKRFVVSCLAHSNKTIVKSNASKHIAIKP